jgi:hypothetical protein
MLAPEVLVTRGLGLGEKRDGGLPDTTTINLGTCDPCGDGGIYRKGKGYNYPA